MINLHIEPATCCRSRSLLNPRLLDRFEDFFVARVAGLLEEAGQRLHHGFQARKRHLQWIDRFVRIDEFLTDALDIQPMKSICM